jgi:hypothetical protein
VVRIRHNKKYLILKRCDTEIEAALLYNKVVSEYSLELPLNKI